MTDETEKYEQIEHYLAGEMPEAERQAFEAALTQDTGLAEAFRLRQALHQSLANRPRRQLLDALADVVEQAESQRPPLILKWRSTLRLAAAAALISAAAVGTWLYFRPETETPKVAVHPAAPPAPAPRVQPAPPPADTPLASADRRAFAPNRALDPLTGTLVRGGNEMIELTSPANDAELLLSGGKVNFLLQGSSTTGQDMLMLRIFNNREADFAAGKAVFGATVSVHEKTFSLKKTLKLPPGRYYVVLTMPEEEEPALVVRFFVK